MAAMFFGTEEFSSSNSSPDPQVADSIAPPPSGPQAGGLRSSSLSRGGHPITILYPPFFPAAAVRVQIHPTLPPIKLFDCHSLK